ncbi:flagellar hook-associated protein 1 FlgK [Acetitomaculum ruminis DSM 5522]|uniref:Flagellar hook-associated protein 1 n=1 Tax=Acetitomaculum ruminis DSM 5522 TaxID=1120918 RepID=A0A1I0WJ88_9FIRM|nr:flagellar hook-associated protein FlgK [Acetitomaculum ruminis]SFA88812.1 flagellar hook-associated protein 1 FlgK [Acetitomaculum ruminis DSM 5522]
MSIFGSLYVGTSGLKTSQNALNITSHNIANVNTEGYTRQQVYQSDLTYIKFGEAGNGQMQKGLGVQVAEAVQVRDYFLDKNYREEYGRKNFYDSTLDAMSEVETLFGELEGTSFSDALKEFRTAFDELDKDPSTSEYQSLVILKGSQIVDRAKSIYDGLVSYQTHINKRITEQVDRINEIGKKITELNREIMKVEAGGVEKANDLRDTRNILLDELSGYVSIDFKENVDGVITVSIEGVEFITEARYNKMDMIKDPITDFATPIWPHLSDGTYYEEVFDLSKGVSTKANTDIGSLKALILARGEEPADYSYIEGMDAATYDKTTGLSAIVNSEAEFDQLIHNLVVAINDILCPNKTITDDLGNTYTVWDAENGHVGSDGQGPGKELFSRKTVPRYNAVELTVNGETSTYYVYNEEDTEQESTMYSIKSIVINEELLADESLFPHRTKSGEIDYGFTESLCDVWDKAFLTLNPDSIAPLNFTDYYSRMIESFSTDMKTVNTMANTLQNEVDTIENKRQQIVGVSSDEELTNMIKFQNAYNASSRYINAVNDMIEVLLTQVGA